MEEANKLRQASSDKSNSFKVLQTSGNSKVMKMTIEAKAAAKPSPSYSKMVVEAIVALKQVAGSSYRAISKFIRDQYKLLDDFTEILLKALMSLTVNEKIVHVSRSFKLLAKNSVEGFYNLSFLL